MILLVDNYDSFTYNLAHLFAELGAEVVVRRNDEIDAAEAERLAPSHLVVSPGPGRPSESGETVAIIRRLSPRVPTLGVCLGHQAIVEAFGGEIGAAQSIVHGKAAAVQHDGLGIFRGLPDGFEAGRYHSLAATRVPDELEVSATTADGEVMAVRHRELWIDGVQFHPESVLTPLGPRSRRTSWRRRRDPGGARTDPRRQRPRPGRGSRGHGRDHARRGDPGADRRLPRGAAAQGRDRGRDHGLRRGDARSRARRAAQARRPRGHRRHGRRRRRHVQHLDRRSARRGGSRRRCCQARQQSRLLVVGLGGRPRVARLRPRAAAGADHALDRPARLRLPFRAHTPSRDAPRGAGSPRARCANGLQRAGAADEPCGRPRAGRRRVRARARADDCARARRSRRAAGVRRPRRGRDRRALAGRAEPRLRGRRRQGAAARDRPSRAWSAPLRSSRAQRRLPGRERGSDPRDLRGRERRRARRGPAERRGRDRRRRGTRRTCARGSASPGRPSTPARRLSDSTS